MPKATVTIDLPDGWELAENEPREPQMGDWYWLIGWAAPKQATRHLLLSGSFIVRRIATEYINVKLRREDVKELLHYSFSGRMIKTMREACSEALSERCGAMLYRNPVSGGGYINWDGGLNNPLTDQQPCTLLAGHASEHGV